ncbi:MAG: site-2 protease family protein [Sphingomonadaceae bacterium]|nr:site-2 protease family protein [Sphingomonadaceae bacterium]
MDNITNYLIQAAAIFGPMVIAITFHEVAHGRVALMLGDHTAKNLGRLSLNPIQHVDPFGTIILPLMLALVGAPVFGWAKPVPVVRERLRSPIVGMALVAAAGPAINLLLALLSAILFAYFAPQIGSFAYYAIAGSLLVNIFLALFNLLPIPPFDGSRIVRPLLSGSWGERWDRFDRAGLGIILIFLVLIPWAVPAFDPLRWIILPAANWITQTMLHLATILTGR